MRAETAEPHDQVRQALTASQSFWEFLATLRLAGYETEPSQVSAAQHVILLAAAGRLNVSRTQLGNYLAAIFAKSAAEQKEIRATSARWFSRLLPKTVEENEVNAPPSTSDSPLSHPASARFVTVRLMILASSAVAGVLISLVIIASSRTFLRTPKPYGGADPPGGSELPDLVSSSAFSASPLLAIFFGAIAIALTIPVVWLISARWGQRFAHNEASITDLQILDSECPQFDEMFFDKAVRNLSRHRRLSTEEIDVERSIDATSRMAGLVSIVHAEKTFTPEYVALIEQFGPNDHLARFSDLVVDRIEQRGIVCPRYYITSPALVADSSGAHLSLSELSDRHLHKRLLVLGPGEAVYDQLSGELAEELRSQLNWDFRGYLVTGDIDGDTAKDLVGAGFVVAPATTGGFRAVSEVVASAYGSVGFLIGDLSGFDTDMPRQKEHASRLQTLRSELKEDVSTPISSTGQIEFNVDSSRVLAELNELVSSYRTLAKNEPGEAEEQLAASLLKLAIYANSVRYWSAASEAVTEAIEIYQKRLPFSHTASLGAAEAFALLAALLNRGGSRAASLAASGEAIRLYRSISEEDPSAAQDLASALLQRAATLRDLYLPASDGPIAVASANLSAEQSRTLIDDAADAVAAYRALRPSRPDTTMKLVAALSNLSFIYRCAGDAKASISLLEEALEALKERISENQEEYLPALVDCLRDLLDLTNSSGQKAQVAHFAIELRNAQELLRRAQLM